MTSQKTLLTILNKENKVQCFLFISMIILMAGIVCNGVAVKENSCKMPVKSDYEFETDCHFSYTDSDTVKFSIFTDIIPVKFGTASIGDFFLLIGVILIILSCFFYIKLKIEECKLVKNN